MLQTVSHEHFQLILNYARLEPGTKFNLSSDLEQFHCSTVTHFAVPWKPVSSGFFWFGLEGRYTCTLYFIELIKWPHKEMKLNSAQASKLYWLGHGQNWQIDSSWVQCVALLGCSSWVQPMQHFSAMQQEHLQSVHLTKRVCSLLFRNHCTVFSNGQESPTTGDAILTSEAKRRCLKKKIRLCRQNRVRLWLT